MPIRGQDIIGQTLYNALVSFGGKVGEGYQQERQMKEQQGILGELLNSGNPYEPKKAGLLAKLLPQYRAGLEATQPSYTTASPGAAILKNVPGQAPTMEGQVPFRPPNPPAPAKSAESLLRSEPKKINGVTKQLDYYGHKNPDGSETITDIKYSDFTPPSGMGQGVSTDDAKVIAQAIMEGKQPPDTKSFYRMVGPVRAELARNGYDFTTANKDWQATQKFLSSLNSTQQLRLRQATTFSYDSLDNIESLYSQLEKTGLPTGFKLWNKAALAAAKNLPGEAGSIAQNLEAQIADLTSELGTVYKGGNSSTDESLKLAAKNLDESWSPQTFKKALSVIRTNLQIRRNSLLTSVPAGLSTEQQSAPTGNQTFSVGGKTYSIPADQVEAFKKDMGIK